MREESDDRAWIKALKSGHARLAGEYVRRSWDGVYAYVLRLVGDPHLAEDIAQETFLRAIESADGLDLERPLKPWLLTVATRLVIDERRRAPTIPIEAAPPRAKEPPDPEMAEILWRAVAGLPARERAALVLRVQENWPHARIAEALGCGVTTARWHLHQARARLREALKEYL